MKLFQHISLILLLASISILCGCKSRRNKTSENLGENKASQSIDEPKQNITLGNENEPEPITCVDWIGYYGRITRQLDSIVSKTDVKVKSEGFDKYNSSDRLEGIYVLRDGDTQIEKIQDLAKYLSYKLCLSDNKIFKGVLMDCQKRKIQVAIARSEKNYNIEAWAVVCNIFPANKKGQVIVLDYIK